MIGIYKITNLINGHQYIGQSINIGRRWKEHRCTAASGLYNEYPLYRAILKYGIENFEFSVIEECSKEELNEKERYWISYYDSYNNGYNQTTGGDGNPHPLKLSEESVLEIYERLKGSDTMESIAKDYGVTHPVISNINTGVLWVHSGISYPIRKREEKKKYFCCDCGKEISSGAIRCNKCSGLHKRTEKPISREELKTLIRTKPFTEIGRMFGVSDNAIKKWCDNYNLPRKKVDIKGISDDDWEKV